MLVVSIAAKNYLEAKTLLDKTKKHPVDFVEFRLDHLDKIDLTEIKKLFDSSKLPKIFTLRKKSQGGGFSKSEQERLDLIGKLFTLKPDYFDLEYDIEYDFVKKIHKKHPKVKLISSYHNFIDTPKDLESIFSNMRKSDFYSYKIATKANSTIDTLRMLNFVNQKSLSPNDSVGDLSTNITGICMGKLGEASRIVSPIINSYFNFTCLEQNTKTASGQIEIDTLINLYNYKKLNNKTSIYALLGYPVEHSIGHIFHNDIFKKEKINALYIKLNLKPEELKEFFPLANTLPFKGFSVTMPLKEKILPYIDELDKDTNIIKSINTIKIEKKPSLQELRAQRSKTKQSRNVKKKRWIASSLSLLAMTKFGFNTDGIGALELIEDKIKVKNKNIIIIGAGGSAKAIAYEAIKSGGNVTIINRSEPKAKEIAETLKCQSSSLDYLKNISSKEFDILINATSIGMKKDESLPLPQELLSSHHIVLDMVAKDTQLLKIAKNNGAITIHGKEVFTKQALAQQGIWFR